MVKGSHHTEKTKQLLRDAAYKRKGITYEELVTYRRRRHVAAMVVNINKRKV